MPLKINIYNGLAIFFAIIGCVGVWISTQKYGIGVITDSYFYLQIAKNFAESPTDYESYRNSFWTPLYPILLGIFLKMGFLGMDIARYINIFAYGLSLLIIYLVVLRPILTTSLIQFFAFFAVLGNYVLYNEASFFMTDMLFIVCCLAFSCACVKYQCSENKMLGLIYMIIFCIAAWLLRYIGVVIWIIGVFWIIETHKKQKIKPILFAVIPFAIFAALPNFIWTSYNLYKDGYAFRQRAWGNGYNLLENIRIVIDYLSFQILPFQLSLELRIVVLLGIAIILYFFLKFDNTETNKINKYTISWLKFSFIFTSIYLIFLLTISSLASFVPLYTRYLAPLTIFVIISFWVIAEIILKSSKKYVKILLISLLSLCTIQHIRGTTQHIIARYLYGAGGMSVDGIKNSELQKFLNKQFFSGEIFSNDPSMCYGYLPNCEISTLSFGETHNNIGLVVGQQKQITNGKILLLFHHRKPTTAVLLTTFGNSFKITPLFKDETATVFLFASLY